MISIHALLAESDILGNVVAGLLMLFLSTLSLRRATCFSVFDFLYLSFLSMLSLRRATVHFDNYNLHCVISIHALLAESDRHTSTPLQWTTLFLSTLSLRRATRRHKKTPHFTNYFYPRSPCGERHADTKNTSFHKLFLSTLSLRRATAKLNIRQIQKIISIHALLAESDSSFISAHMGSRIFLSTLSLRRATDWSLSICFQIGISIHALLAESDLAYPDMIICTNVISIHALLAESDCFARCRFWA